MHIRTMRRRTYPYADNLNLKLGDVTIYLAVDAQEHGANHSIQLFICEDDIKEIELISVVFFCNFSPGSKSTRSAITI